MNRENLIQYLYTQGKGGWATGLIELWTEYEADIRQLQDSLAEMHKLYQDLKDERRRASTE